MEISDLCASVLHLEEVAGFLGEGVTPIGYCALKSAVLLALIGERVGVGLVADAFIRDVYPLFNNGIVTALSFEKFKELAVERNKFCAGNHCLFLSLSLEVRILKAFQKLLCGGYYSLCNIILVRRGARLVAALVISR